MNRHQVRLLTVKRALDQMIERGQISQEGYDSALDSAWKIYDNDLAQARQDFDAVCDVIWADERAYARAHARAEEGRLDQAITGA